MVGIYVLVYMLISVIHYNGCDFICLLDQKLSNINFVFRCTEEYDSKD